MFLAIWGLASVSIELSYSTSYPSAIDDQHRESYNRLAAIYGLDPLPPPIPATRSSKLHVESSSVTHLDGGIIMAARRIQAALCPGKRVRAPWGIPIPDQVNDFEPIPGWTDGSNAWRASVYGLAPPRDFARSDPDEAAIRAYGSYTASSHRPRAAKVQLQNAPPDVTTQRLSREFSASITRRSESYPMARRSIGCLVPHASDRRSYSQARS